MLQLVNINKSFGSKQVAKDINLTFNKGEVVGLIGKSGCGKSTLLRIINNLETQDSGKVILNNTEINKSNLTKMRSKIGFVFQSFNLFSNMNVIENVTLGLVHVQNLSKTDAFIKAELALKQVGLSHKMHELPKNLSGGEKQRAAIARTIAMNPEVILFDEPTSALDPKTVKEIIDLISKITGEDKIAIIVTHEMYFLKNVTTRVIMLNDGKVEYDMPKQEFFSSNHPEINSFMNLEV